MAKAILFLVRATGVAAAIAARQGISPDEIDVQAMRKILIDGGAIV